MGSFSDRKVSRFIESVYEASTDLSFDGWTGVFKEFASTVSSGPGSMSVHSAPEDEFRVVTSSVDPDVLKQYFEHYQYISPFKKALASLKPGERFSRREFMRDDAYLKSSYYNEFSLPQGVFELEHHVLSSDAGLTGGISITRPKHRPEFSRDERRFITAGVHHLRKAFANYLALSRLTNENRIYDDILGSAGCALFVVDPSLKVIYSNRVAEDEFRKAGLIRLTEAGKIKFRSNRAMRELQTLASVLHNATLFGTVLPRSLRIGKDRDGSDVFLDVAFGGRTGCDGSKTNRTIALYFKKKLAPTNSIHSIASRYGITAAEMRVIELLVAGNNVKTICELLKISENTVRTHLKRAFAKTGTNRQVDLVRMMLS